MTTPAAAAAELSQALADGEAKIDRIVQQYREGREQFGEPHAMTALAGAVLGQPKPAVVELLLSAISRMARTEVPGGEQL